MSKKKFLRQEPTDNFVNSRLFLGISLVVLGVILVFGHGGRPALKDSFANEPVKVEGFSEGKRQEGKEPLRVVIPDAGIDLPVKRAEIIRGYWEVFPDTAAWGSGSGYPGEAGNQVVFAHAREGLFLPLKEVELNDKVYIFTKDGWFDYKVTEIKDVYPNQIQVVAPTNDETLTLYTCTGYQDSKRLIVIAKRV